MNRLAIVIGAGGITLALAGCAEQPIVWRADGGQQFKQDNYQCVQESRTSWSGGGSGVVGPLMILGAKRDAETESRRLYIMCMEARGYSQVKPGGPYLGLNARPDERGLRIQSLVPGGPAENAGLRLDDIISEMDDRRIAVLDDLRAVVDSKSPGDRVNLVVVRDGVAQRITLTVGRRP
jgi:membrane-associated protease RseP (regulator of RpoE activity)